MIPTRETGSWMPGIEDCTNRVQPCGNAYCADEAMRAKDIRESSWFGSKHALKHALSIASGCFTVGCPMATYTGETRSDKAVKSFYDNY